MHSNTRTPPTGCGLLGTSSAERIDGRGRCREGAGGARSRGEGESPVPATSGGGRDRVGGMVRKSCDKKEGRGGKVVRRAGLILFFPPRTHKFPGSPQALLRREPLGAEEERSRRSHLPPTRLRSAQRLPSSEVSAPGRAGRTVTCRPARGRAGRRGGSGRAGMADVLILPGVGGLRSPTARL